MAESYNCQNFPTDCCIIGAEGLKEGMYPVT